MVQFLTKNSLLPLFLFVIACSHFTVYLQVARCDFRETGQKYMTLVVAHARILPSPFAHSLSLRCLRQAPVHGLSYQDTRPEIRGWLENNQIVPLPVRCLRLAVSVLTYSLSFSDLPREVRPASSTLGSHGGKKRWIFEAKPSYS